MKKVKEYPDYPVLLFDGYCNFCDATVQFIMKRDHKAKVKYAPLQSEMALSLLEKLGYDSIDMSTAVLVEKDRVYTKSDVAIQVTKYFRFPWPIAQVLVIFPKFLRDPFYDLIARNRYRWWGKKETCRIPSAEERSRFLA